MADKRITFGITRMITSIILLFIPLFINAYDIEIDGIYYNLVPKAKIAEVTYGASEKASYSGHVIIPATIQHEGSTYNVASVGTNAFYYCKELTAISIPQSITSIGTDAFYQCNNLKEVHITSIEAWCNISFYNEKSFNGPSNPLRYAHHLYLEGKEITDLVIPHTVTKVAKAAFYKCEGITSVTISESMKEIDELTFSGCSGIKEITIPDNIIRIGTGAFSECSNLMSAIIGKGVTRIDDIAFSSCISLSEIEIPDNVTSIGSSFQGCTNLTKAKIGNGVTSLPATFAGCSKLEMITLPQSITTLDLTFWECTNLQNIELPNSLTVIGACSFYGCNSLQTIHIPKNIERIEDEAFANCKELTDVYCHSTIIPETKENAFNNSYIDFATLHVPDDVIQEYKETIPWNGFKSIVGILSREEIDLPKCSTPTIKYENGNLMFECETQGAQFISEITNTDIGKHYGNNIEITAAYEIKVYATADEYENSDTVTATLCWIDKEPATQGITNKVISIDSKPTIIQSRQGTLYISGIKEGTPIRIFSTDGKHIETGKVTDGNTYIKRNLNKGTTYIIEIGNKTFKSAIQ